MLSYSNWDVGLHGDEGGGGGMFSEESLFFFMDRSYYIMQRLDLIDIGYIEVRVRGGRVLCF
jgi:hypothetical protein